MNRHSRETIAWRAAADLAEGSYVNLGIGLPTLVARFVPAGREIIFQSENGVLGVGPPPPPGTEDIDLVNAGKEPITLIPGASIFDHPASFMMLRGGHIDVALMGAYQVAENGDLANWATDREARPPAVGGAMDIAVGARNVHVLMEHTMRDGAPRLLRACTYPLTAIGVVKRIYTNLAVIDVQPGAGFIVREIAGDVTREELERASGAALHLAPDLKEMPRRP